MKAQVHASLVPPPKIWRSQSWHSIRVGGPIGSSKSLITYRKKLPVFGNNFPFSFHVECSLV